MVNGSGDSDHDFFPTNFVFFFPSFFADTSTSFQTLLLVEEVLVGFVVARVQGEHLPNPPLNLLAPGGLDWLPCMMGY